ncbi:hypothetical protein Dvina_43605 [Dactylosporangium vinaceum]|uniref:Uncharacterized protein n=1 Tax=Dactylosporangium vinaceum TaxID=53362 RepID=A0ABV5MH11_9ACTN|nr:hypothetical protein Dvina_43605 [Dactylosporangium vinaceum]
MEAPFVQRLGQAVEEDGELPTRVRLGDGQGDGEPDLGVLTAGGRTHAGEGDSALARDVDHERVGAVLAE